MVDLTNSLITVDYTRSLTDLFALALVEGFMEMDHARVLDRRDLRLALDRPNFYGNLLRALGLYPWEREVVRITQAVFSSFRMTKDLVVIKWMVTTSENSKIKDTLNRYIDKPFERKTGKNLKIAEQAAKPITRFLYFRAIAWQRCRLLLQRTFPISSKDVLDVASIYRYNLQAKYRGLTIFADVKSQIGNFMDMSEDDATNLVEQIVSFPTHVEARELLETTLQALDDHLNSGNPRWPLRVYNRCILLSRFIRRYESHEFYEANWLGQLETEDRTQSRLWNEGQSLPALTSGASISEVSTPGALTQDIPEQDALEHDALEQAIPEQDALGQDALGHDALRLDPLKQDDAPVHDAPIESAPIQNEVETDGIEALKKCVALMYEHTSMKAKIDGPALNKYETLMYTLTSIKAKIDGLGALQIDQALVEDFIRSKTEFEEAVSQEKQALERKVLELQAQNQAVKQEVGQRKQKHEQLKQECEQLKQESEQLKQKIEQQKQEKLTLQARVKQKRLDLETQLKTHRLQEELHQQWLAQSKLRLFRLRLHQLDKVRWK